MDIRAYTILLVVFGLLVSDAKGKCAYVAQQMMIFLNLIVLRCEMKVVGCKHKHDKWQLIQYNTV